VHCCSFLIISSVSGIPNSLRISHKHYWPAELKAFLKSRSILISLPSDLVACLCNILALCITSWTDLEPRNPCRPRSITRILTCPGLYSSLSNLHCHCMPHDPPQHNFRPHSHSENARGRVLTATRTCLDRQSICATRRTPQVPAVPHPRYRVFPYSLRHRT